MSTPTGDPFRALKDAFGRFATGITVATACGPDGERVAMTVNSFASVSLAPPLVLWCIEARASSFPVFSVADNYAISVLRCDQRAASEAFARRGAGALADHATETWETGAPVLKERLAGFDCRVVARHQAGDHLILVARVLRFDAQKGAPLLYFASAYAEGPYTT